MPLRRRDVFIGVFLAVQIALPLHYYTVRADKNDERFSWRMFSTNRMLRCTPRFFLNNASKPMRLHSEFHDAWITLAKRGRIQVVAAMAHHVCSAHEGASLRVQLPCTDAHGKTHELTADGWDVCALGGLQ